MKKHIVITGSHSVGKTSLLESTMKSLAAKGRSISYIPEMARLLIAEGIQMNADVDEYGVCTYLGRYLKYCRETTENLILSDRSIFDLYVYLTVNKSDLIRENVIGLVWEMVLKEFSKFHFAYIPIEFPMAADGVRPEDNVYRNMVDSESLRLLKINKASFSIVAGSLSNRAEEIEKLFDEIPYK